MPPFRLHYFPESGNSYKLALMLTLCGQSFEPVWTDFGGGVTRTEQWRREVNAMGEIPVLEIDGKAVTQTAPILLRLAERFAAFGPRDAAHYDEILRWLFWDNQKLSGYMATYRYYRAFTPSPDPGMMTHFRRRLDDFLGILAARVDASPFVAGEEPTVADISMIAYLSFPKEEAGFDFAISHPAIAGWLGRVAQLPGWHPPYELLPGKRLKSYVS
jgi:glutathione S-transferase